MQLLLVHPADSAISRNRNGPFRLLLFAVAGWMSYQQQHIIDYLREENRVLHAQLGIRRLRFDDEQRRRLAVRAKLLGRRVRLTILGTAFLFWKCARKR